MSIKYTIHVYKCVNTRCRNVEEKEGMPTPSRRCERCGSRMAKIGTRKVGGDK